MPMGYRLTQPDWQGIPGGDPSSPYYHTLASEPVVPTGRPLWPPGQQVSKIWNQSPKWLGRKGSTTRRARAIPSTPTTCYFI